MAGRTLKLVSTVALAALLAACGSSDYSDLDQFMDEVRAKPAGTIKPIPPIQTYKAFNYAASAMRSPFDRPVDVKEIAEIQVSSNVKPDPDRPREYLEEFSLDSLSMVGSIQMGGTRWALIKDGDGSVHRVKRGMHLGRNHGRIVESEEGYVALIEIVANGSNGWIERPRTIKLQQVDTR